MDRASNDQMSKLRYFILLLLIGLFTKVWAGGYAVIEVGGGGGYSSLGYRTQTFDQAGLQLRSLSSYTYTGHVGLAYMIRPFIGLSVGANFTRVGGGVALDGQMLWRDVADTEGERYNHIARLRDWSEKQQITMVEIPVSLCFGAGINAPVEFTGEVGVKIGLPMSSTNSLMGEVTHVGDYGLPWGMTIDPLYHHGFYTTRFEGQPALKAQTTYSLFLKAGIQVPIEKSRVVWFYSVVYGAYALNNAFATGEAELGFANDGLGQEDAHAFMTDYTSVVDTRYIQSVHPIQLGLELGLRFFLYPVDKYKCHCVNDKVIR